MHKALKIEILKKFDTQGDFAVKVGMHESKVSQVIRNRRKLTKKQADIWLKALKCDPSIFEPVIQ